MPLNDYLCDECGYKEEKILPSDTGVRKCPDCGKKKLRKAFFSSPHLGIDVLGNNMHNPREAPIYKDLNKKYQKMAKEAERKQKLG
jgi:putative FmdB family regulatory protein